MLGLKIKPIHGLLFICETLLLMCAQAMAFVFRFEFSSWQLLNYPNLAYKFFLVIFLVQLCFYYNNLYQFGHVRAPHVLALKILQSVLAATIALVAIYYVFSEMHIGRGVFIPTMVLIFSFAYLWRYSLYIFSRKGFLTRRVLVIGSGACAVNVIRHLSNSTQFAYELVGFLEEDLASLGPLNAIASKVVGSYDTLFQTAVSEHVELIIVAMEDRRGKLPLNDLAECKLNNMEVLEASKFWELEKGVISVEGLRPSWLVFSDGFRQSQVTTLLKSVTEFILSTCLFILCLPLLLFTAIAIRLTSPGPILYRQIRVGARGRVFTLYKFRSMKVDAESDGKARWAVENDSRVTRVGKFLRKYRLDELPQLINVMRGEMSLVGPRPERPTFVNELKEKIPCYLQRHAVRPGVTGLAQVRYRYGSSMEDAVKKLEYDLYYVKNLSIFLDLSILIDTFKVVFMGEGAR